MFAVAAHVGEREAHAREVERSGADWPDGSYGRRNRQAIAARETRVATRLRAIQHAYQAVAGPAFTPPEPARTLRPSGYAADKEIELEQSATASGLRLSEITCGIRVRTGHRSCSMAVTLRA